MLWYPYSLIPDGKKRHSRIWPKWVQLNMAWFSRSRVFNKGRFRFPVWRNFGNSTYTQWNGTFRLHRPEPSNHAFGYCSCKQDTKTAVLGTTILTNGTGYFGPTHRDNQAGQSGAPSKLVPSIPVGSNRNGLFQLMYQPTFPEFWVERKAPIVY